MAVLRPCAQLSFPFARLRAPSQWSYVIGLSHVGLTGRAPNFPLSLSASSLLGHVQQSFTFSPRETRITTGLHQRAFLFLPYEPSILISHHHNIWAPNVKKTCPQHPTTLRFLPPPRLIPPLRLLSSLCLLRSLHLRYSCSSDSHHLWCISQASILLAR